MGAIYSPLSNIPREDLPGAEDASPAPGSKVSRCQKRSNSPSGSFSRVFKVIPWPWAPSAWAMCVPEAPSSRAAGRRTFATTFLFARPRRAPPLTLKYPMIDWSCWAWDESSWLVEAISSGRGGVLLDDLVQLLNGLVDLFGPGILLRGGGGDFLDQIGGFLDIRDQLGQFFPRPGP